MRPTFSIVVPTLNEEKFLPQLLDTLANQTDQDFEVIIADGNSEDKTVAIAKKYEKKINITVVTCPRRGVAYQRNYGTSQAKGKWILSSDADSTFQPYCIARMKKYLAKRRLIHFVAWFTPDTDNVNDALLILMINSGIELSVKMKRPAAYGAFYALKREIFDDIHGFDESLEFGEDNDICRRAYEHTGSMLGVIREGLTSYSLRRFHKHGVGKTLQQYARATLMLVLTKRTPSKLPGYIMGGQVYSEKEEKKRESILKNYERTLKEFMDELTK